MAELQYVLSNQAVPPFCAFNQKASLLSHHLKLKKSEFKCGRTPFSCVLARLLPCYTIYLYFLYMQTCCKSYLSEKWKNPLLLFFRKPKKQERQITKIEAVTLVVFDTEKLFC